MSAKRWVTFYTVKTTQGGIPGTDTKTHTISFFYTSTLNDHFPSEEKIREEIADQTGETDNIELLLTMVFQKANMTIH